MYPYLKNLIQLCLGDWVKNTEKTNLEVGMKNHNMISGGKKCLFRPFRRQ